MIDSHSHLGEDSHFPLSGEIREYVKNALKIGINEANLICVPCPRYKEKDKIVQPFIWEFKDSKFRYYRAISDSKGNRKLLENPKNPYREYNKFIFKETKKAKGIKINFIPLSHPIFDSLDYVKKLLKEKPRAIKVHGIAYGIGPKQIPKKWAQLISKANIPLIVHTDYNSKKEITNGLEYLYSINLPLDWINFLSKYKIKGFLAHGARLNKKSLEIVVNSDNFLVGISPDLLIEDEKERVYPHKGAYLKSLINIVGPNKLALDIDYPWNVKKRGSKTLDWKIVNRLKKYLNKKELELVCSKNAREFFALG